MMDQVVLNRETERQLRQEKEELESQLREISERLTLVTKKLDALPLFLPHNGSPGNQSVQVRAIEEAKATSNVNVLLVPPPSEAILSVVRKAGRPLTAIEIRRLLQAERYPMEKFGSNLSYYYTLLIRLLRGGKLVRVRGGKYSIGPDIQEMLKQLGK